MRPGGPPPRVAVIIPVFNERASLPLVLAAIPGDAIHEIVVVDNGSTDGTADVAREARAPVPIRIVREERRGYGSACLAGVASLAPCPPDFLVFLDGDFSDHPEEMPRLLARLEDGADLVIGSRTLGRREPGALPPQARFGNALACALIRAFYGHRYTDLGPFRAIRLEAYRGLGMRDTDFGWTCEMQVKALKRSLRVAEVPVSYRRRVGVSKITGTLSGTIRAGWKILTTIFRVRFGRDEPALESRPSSPPA